MLSTSKAELEVVVTSRATFTHPLDGMCVMNSDRDVRL